MALIALYSRPRLFLQPRGEEELVDILKAYGRKARIIAGGTGIYELSGRGLLPNVEVLVDITKLPLSYIRSENSMFMIGATTPLVLIQSCRDLNEPSVQALLDSVKAVQPLQVKNVATIAGAICTALPFLDVPVALYSLDASVLLGPENKEITAYEFVQGYLDIQLSECEYVKEVRFARKERTGTCFMKFSLTGDDWAIANCSVSVTVNNGLLEKAVIYIGGAFGEKALRARNTENELADLRISEIDRIKEIVDKNLEKDAKAESDVKASSWYRLEVAKVISRRALTEACRRAVSSA